MRKMFALRRVKIFHTPPHSGTNQLTREIVEEACGYLDTIIKSGMTIGFSWGRNHLSDFFQYGKPPSNQKCHGNSPVRRNQQSDETNLCFRDFH